MTVIDLSIETLARSNPRVDLDEGALNTIAHLALRLAQTNIRRTLVVPIDADMRPYLERSEGERTRMRAGVYRVVQALVLLGWIERPA